MFELDFESSSLASFCEIVLDPNSGIIQISFKTGSADLYFRWINLLQGEII